MALELKDVRFPFPRGPVAASPQAWGQEFAVIVGERRAPFEMAGAMAVIDIAGPLQQKSHWLLDSYESIRARVIEACKSEAATICLRLSSPGGEFAGAIELARELKEMAAASGKRLVAFTDSVCASAAYAIACAAESITITPSAFVGSIGIWAPLQDVTAQDRMMGRAIVIVASGERKTDGNPHVAITDDAIDAMREKVDAMAGLFFELVAESRGMKLSAIKALEGGEHFGTKAQSLGLADNQVKSFSDFVSLNNPAATANVKGKKMATSYAEALAAMKAAADDGDEKAKSALAKFGDEDEDKKKEAKAKAKAEDEKKEEMARAAAATPGFATAAELQQLRAEIFQERETAKRETFLATRPDFSKAIVDSLRGAPLALVKEACETWPKVPGAAAASVAAATAQPTRGDTQTGNSADDNDDASNRPLTDAQLIDKKMGFGAMGPSEGVRIKGNSMTLGFLNASEAEAAARKHGLLPPASADAGKEGN